MHLKLHGPPTLQQAGQPPESLERKQAALLAYLDHAGPTPRALLAGLLWPQAPSEGARSNLRQCIARLRRLAPDLLVDAAGLLSIAPGATVLPADPPGSALLANLDYADCDEFDRWLQARRDDDRGAQRSSLTAAIREATQRGDLAHAQALADTLLGLDRESEDSYRALMELAYLRGDFAAALAVLGRCTRMLEELYGVGPSAATRELGRTIVAAARQGELRREVAASTAGIPLSVLRPPRLIARSAQLGAMLAAWRNGLVLCVCGEGGIGKSRLLAEFAAAVGPGVSVAARPGDAGRPYATLTRLVIAAVERHRPATEPEQAAWIARLLPAVDPLLRAAATPTAPLQTERERALALAALHELLATCARRGCAVFVLDDLHFADRATVEALPALVVPEPSRETDAAGTAAGPRFALGSRLDDADAASTQLIESLAASRDVLRIDLGPLADAEIRELVESLALPDHDAAELSGRLRAQVGGNPAFLLETLKLLLSVRPTASDAAAPLPVAPGIEAVIQRRIAMLGAPARHIAQLAAIAGSSYDLAMAAAALAFPLFALTEPLRELEQRQVLHGRQFVHDLVASAARRSIPASVAEFMERFVAEYLEAQSGDPAVVAGHWRASGEWHRAGDGFLRAAAANAAAIRPREEAEHLDAAIDCFDRAGADEPLFRAIVMRLDVFEVADRTAVRSRLLERLDRLASSEEQALHALLHRLAFRTAHAQADVLAGLEDGLRRARAIGERRLEFEFVEPIAQLLSSHGRFQEAIDLLASVAPWTEAQPDARLRGRLERTLAAAHTHCDHLGLAIEHGDRAIAVFRSVGDDLNSLPTMSNVGIARLWRGELAEARTVLEQALEVRDRLHGGLAPNILDINLASVLRDLGEFALADERFSAIAEATRQSLRDSTDEPATDLALTENHHAQMWLMLGLAERALAVMRVDDSAVETRFRARRLALRLRAARLLGRGTDALAAAAAALLPGIDSAFHRSLLELELLRSAAPPEAAAGYERLHAEPAVIERPGLRLHAAVRSAAARLACGDTAAAASWMEAASTSMVAVVPFDMAREEPWRIASDVFAARDDMLAAAGATQRAEQIVADLRSGLPAAWFAA